MHSEQSYWSTYDIIGICKDINTDKLYFTTGVAAPQYTKTTVQHVARGAQLCIGFGKERFSKIDCPGMRV